MPESTDSGLLTALLSEQHRLIQRAVVALARLCAHLRRDGEVQREAGDALLRFLREYADSHHHAAEEDVLFPWMISQGFPREAGPIAVMLHEHGEARAHVQAMADAHGALSASASDAAARASFVEHGESYATLLWQHIWKEDGILYPMAEELAAGTAGLHHPGEAHARIEAEHRALVADLEQRAQAWPPEDVRWPQGCR